ncbi:DEHA2F11946p [Debaryomyces hansenii CBS767]|uniref:DEHA2F11946p n=1 Tax=Debaryomyces hansenii (strain ATCC 36239 / CBS 767 / BCRC 21394 / JCM 1990 / NBRC 0083 / IGC 2968) TaxID=284592 RepID=B5RUE7_DEBHA|nr:DEHA2F11946p [Debaryomyces hansenii CBS767]CAR66325.1 DEHA2F11946p [Debaryomyces hansenii CBS767]|eukprot:XP_002770800.1 DEHA2F11946p [Debaryomyces hansenii CBS767]
MTRKKKKPLVFVTSLVETGGICSFQSYYLKSISPIAPRTR